MNGACGVDRVRPFVDVANDAILIDDEGDAIGKEASEAENAVSLGHLLLGVAQQRETRSRLFGKLAVPVLTIETNPQHLRPRGFELGYITLIRLNLFRSTGRGGANIKGQDDGFLAAEVRELHELSILIGQHEVRGAVTDLQSRRCTEHGHR